MLTDVGSSESDRDENRVKGQRVLVEIIDAFWSFLML